MIYNVIQIDGSFKNVSISRREMKDYAIPIPKLFRFDSAVLDCFGRIRDIQANECKMCSVGLKCGAVMIKRKLSLTGTLENEKFPREETVHPDSKHEEAANEASHTVGGARSQAVE